MRLARDWLPSSYHPLTRQEPEQPEVPNLPHPQGDIR